MSFLDKYSEQYHLRVFLSSYSILTITLGLILFTQRLTITSGGINETTASLFMLALITGVVGFFYYVLTMTSAELLNKPVFVVSLMFSSVFLVSILVEGQKVLLRSQVVSQKIYIYVFVVISLLVLKFLSAAITVYSTISSEQLTKIEQSPDE